MIKSSLLILYNQFFTLTLPAVFSLFPGFSLNPKNKYYNSHTQQDESGKAHRPAVLGIHMRPEAEACILAYNITAV
jgi:hypothetical protein